MDAKTISFALMMGVLGNVLFAVSYSVGQLAPGIALDFSLIAVFIAGYYGGPLTGFVAGLFVGIMPGTMFGPLGMSSWLGMFGLPLGKAMTGLTAGIVSRGLRLRQRPHSSIITVPVTFLSYIPEFLFTYAFFTYLIPLFLPGSFVPSAVVYGILLKAVGEVTIMSFLMATLTGNSGFNDFVSRFFAKSNAVPKTGIRASG